MHFTDKSLSEHNIGNQMKYPKVKLFYQDSSIERSLVDERVVIEKWSVAHCQSNQNTHGRAMGKVGPRITMMGILYN
jgi:hypothetical protein